MITQLEYATNVEASTFSKNQNEITLSKLRTYDLRI